MAIIFSLLFLVVAALIAYRFFGDVDYPRDTAAQAGLYGLTTQLNVYKDMNGFYPTAEQGLIALVVHPNSSPVPQHWQQLVFFDTLLDPWHHGFAYRFPDPKNPNSFDLFSLGPDGVESDDDIRVPR